MVLFETVRDLRFADNIENALSSIDNELKKANLLKERELELKEEEFDQFTKTFNRNKTEYKEYCEQVQQNFGSSFMFFDFENRKYICYDFIQGENGLPNIEEITNRELALQWLDGQIEIDEVREIGNKMDIELDIEM